MDHLERSPSSRRAWIEISNALICGSLQAVALLAEGVDRNRKIANLSNKNVLSPSSRRAWIEIEKSIRRRNDRHVALLAEGVDRNHVRSS